MLSERCEERARIFFKYPTSNPSEIAQPAQCSSRPRHVRDQGKWNQLELYRIKLENKSERTVKIASMDPEEYNAKNIPCHLGAHTGFVTCQ